MAVIRQLVMSSSLLLGLFLASFGEGLVSFVFQLYVRVEGISSARICYL
jgi:hypothetical protein